MQQSNNHRVICIRKIDEFYRIKEEWNQLATLVRTHRVFLRHEWFAAAWAWRQAEFQPRFLLIYNHNKLIGIFPLVISITKQQGLAIRQLEFLTAPDTQFCDFIAAEEYYADAVGLAAEWLSEHQAEWTMIKLSYLPEHSKLMDFLPAAMAQYKMHYSIEDADRNPYIDLSTSWEVFYRGRSRRLKKGNNLVTNKLQKAGKPEIEWLYGKLLDQKKITAILDQVIRLSSNSWKQSTGFSLDHSGPNTFIKKLTTEADRNQWLSVWLLRLDGYAIAMEYQLIDQSCVYALRADFDEAYSHLSPGTYLNWKIIETLFDQGMKSYFMGPGRNPYKLRWTDAAVPLKRITGYSHSTKGRASAVLILKLIPAAKYVINKYRRLLGKD